MSLHDIPVELKRLPQWVNWKLTQRKGEDKPTKVPCHPDIKRTAKSNDASTWSAFEEVVTAYESGVGDYSGIGFVFSEDDTFAGIDLDHCILPDGTLTPFAAEVVALLNSYTEISPSGTGLHIYVHSRAFPEGQIKNEKIEMYRRSRYFTCTGNVWLDVPIAWRDEELKEVHGRVFGRKIIPKNTPKISKQQFARTEGSLSLDDEQIKERMFASGDGDKLRFLWEGRYPEAGYKTQSEADCGLCYYIGLYGERDPDLIDRVFRESGMFRDNKWDRRARADGTTYGQVTIAKSLEGKSEPFSTFSSFSTPMASPSLPPDENIVYNTISSKIDYIGNRESVENDENVENEMVWPACLTIERSDLPHFPLDSYPPWLSDFLTALSVSTQTPLCFSGMMALSALSLCCSRKYEVVGKPGWREPLSLFTVTTGAPGTRKSSVCEAIMLPMKLWESVEIEKTNVDRAKVATTREVLEMRRKEATTKAAKAEAGFREGLIYEAQEAATALSAVKERGAFRLFTEDCTPEKLVMLMADNDGKVGILSAEGDIFDIIAGRYSDKPAMGVYLKGHSGEMLNVDRASRASVRVDRPTLTIGLSIQPGVLRKMTSQLSLRENGLLARFLYSLPKDNLGYRDLDAPEVPEFLSILYAKGIEALLEDETLHDEHGNAVPKLLMLDLDAYQYMRGFQQEVEYDLQAEGDFGDMQDWGGKFPGAVLRIAALLHLAEHALDLRHIPLTITGKTMLAAIRIGQYLQPHARAAYEEMGGDIVKEQARMLVTWVRGKGIREVRMGELHRQLYRKFSKSEDMIPALRLLANRNYLIEILPTAEEKKHNGKSRIVFNPAIWESKGG